MAKQVNDRFEVVLQNLEKIIELEIELGVLSALNTKARRISPIERLFKSLAQEAFLFQRKHTGEKAEAEILPLEYKTEPLTVTEKERIVGRAPNKRV
jgi:hypothetical protein